MPGISDHEAVYIVSDIITKRQKLFIYLLYFNVQVHHKILLWKRAGMENLKLETRDFSTNFTESVQQKHQSMHCGHVYVKNSKTWWKNMCLTRWHPHATINRGSQTWTKVSKDARKSAISKWEGTIPNEWGSDTGAWRRKCNKKAEYPTITT